MDASSPRRPRDLLQICRDAATVREYARCLATHAPNWVERTVHDLYCLLLCTSFFGWP